MSTFWSPFVFHAVVWTVVVVAGVVTYMVAVSSRRRITCRSCGERVQTEHDTIQHCPSCGAPLK